MNCGTPCSLNQGMKWFKVLSSQLTLHDKIAATDSVDRIGLNSVAFFLTRENENALYCSLVVG